MFSRELLLSAALRERISGLFCRELLLSALDYYLNLGSQVCSVANCCCQLYTT
jgi:hypothetical protein